MLLKQLSRPGVVITPPCKEGRECETIGRFAGLLSAFGSRQGNKKTVKTDVGNDMPFTFAK